MYTRNRKLSGKYSVKFDTMIIGDIRQKVLGEWPHFEYAVDDIYTRAQEEK